MAGRRRDESTPRPTDAELAILRVLWERGRSTVREVHEALSSVQGSGYTTVLKQLQIMTEKGLVVRNEAQRAHVYEPRLSEERTQRQLLADLADRAFGGSSAKLVLQALAGRRSTAQQRRDIRALLGELLMLAETPEPDEAKVHRTLRALRDRFDELTTRAQAFMSSLQRTIKFEKHPGKADSNKITALITFEKGDRVKGRFTFEFEDDDAGRKKIKSLDIEFL